MQPEVVMLHGKPGQSIGKVRLQKTSLDNYFPFDRIDALNRKIDLRRTTCEKILQRTVFFLLTRRTEGQAGQKKTAFAEERARRFQKNGSTDL